MSEQQNSARSIGDSLDVVADEIGRKPAPPVCPDCLCSQSPFSNVPPSEWVAIHRLKWCAMGRVL